MSLYLPSGYKIPVNITTLEASILHDVLVASLIYQGSKVIEDDGIARPVCQWFPFIDGTNRYRIGFRGSWEVQSTITASGAEQKDWWEYVVEHDIVQLPTQYYDSV